MKDERVPRRRKNSEAFTNQKPGHSIGETGIDRQRVLQDLFSEECGVIASVRPEEFLLAVLCCRLSPALADDIVCKVYTSGVDYFEAWVTKKYGKHSSKKLKMTRAEYILCGLEHLLPRDEAEKFRGALSAMHQEDSQRKPTMNVWAFAAQFEAQVLGCKLIDYYRVLTKKRHCNFV